MATAKDLAKTFGISESQGQKAANLFAKGAAEKTAATAPKASTPSPYYPRYTQAEQAATDYLDKNSFVAPKSEDQIYKEKAAQAQGQIDGLQKHYDNLVAEQRIINEGRDRSTASVNTLTGLAGSTEANVQQQKTTAINQKDVQRIRDEQNLAIQSLLGQVRKSAVEEARQQRLDARADAESVLKRRTERQTQATTQLTTLAQSGITADGLRSTDPESYDYFVKSMGGEQMVTALFTLNRPQETILDKRVENGKYVIAWQNPLDGRIRIDTLDLGLPPEYTKTIDAGDRILAMPSNWDGDPSKLITINKGLTPNQAQTEGEHGENPQLYAGLSSKTATAVRAKVNGWKSEGVVTNFSTIQEGRNFAGSLDDKTTNPADDQALIYALAKALDPGSVVREGEYATAQKYAQSWIAAYGKGVSQALLGTGFLSEAARRNIKDTIEARYKASKTGYESLLKQYESGINALTGRSDGKSFLTDYTVQTPQSRTLVKDGQAFDASDLSEEEFQQALADGYVEQ